MADTFTLGGELEVRRLGFGAMRVTGEGVWGDPPDRAAAKALLRRVVELGVNLIDTADSYGPDVSEELLAEALHPYPEGVVIATKGGFTRPGPSEWVPDCRPERQGDEQPDGDRIAAAPPPDALGPPDRPGEYRLAV